MPSRSLKLKSGDLDAALKFIETSGASSFFPQQFEWDAIRANWIEVRSALLTTDIANYQGNAPFTAFVPKRTLTIRPVQAIDPIDLIVYTALTYRIAKNAESKRANTIQVFSYHFNEDSSKGFTLENNWDGFDASRRSKCEKVGYIALTDIVDFFPRVYQHRLNNAIVDLTGLETEAWLIERLLRTWSDGTSYGLPVGPLASNYLAELTLSEVDEFLDSEGVDFVRYVDDYAIFGNSHEQLVDQLHLLAQRLHLSQGLSLNLSKTRIITCSEFQHSLTKPDEELEARRQEIIDRVFEGDPYFETPIDDLSDEDLALVEEMHLEEQFINILGQEDIDPQPVRLILTLMGSLQSPDLIKHVLDNLGRLTPASEAVGRFFAAQKGQHSGDLKTLGEKLLRAVERNPDIRDHQSIWLVEPFTQSNDWGNLTELRRLRRRHGNTWVRRQISLAIGLNGSRSALLDLRHDLSNRTDWERRAMIYACRGLPTDERQAFCRTVRPKGKWTASNALEKAVVALTENGNRT